MNAELNRFLLSLKYSYLCRVYGLISVISRYDAQNQFVSSFNGLEITYRFNLFIHHIFNHFYLSFSAHLTYIRTSFEIKYGSYVCMLWCGIYQACLRLDGHRSFDKMKSNVIEKNIIRDKDSRVRWLAQELHRIYPLRYRTRHATQNTKTFFYPRGRYVRCLH